MVLVRDVTLPGASKHAFWLNGSAWEYPDFENADVFVARLARKGVIARDAIVDAVLHKHAPALSIRSTQRHFLRATGMTYSTWRQIERARHATNLLREGAFSTPCTKPGTSINRTSPDHSRTGSGRRRPRSSEGVASCRFYTRRRCAC